MPSQQTLSIDSLTDHLVDNRVGSIARKTVAKGAIVPLIESVRPLASKTQKNTQKSQEVLVRLEF